MRKKRVVLDKATMAPHKHGNDRAPKVKPPKITWDPREIRKPDPPSVGETPERS